ncbi:OmpA family protein [Flectobacillus sp. DC10W]|jgi:outer membrane protein OmpA-like peptidoglycan-associated protein|uniref:OmpA family protein n=1 Tax=Flectobacillus longus TaxID=2984207 RepID=A0ABT6YTK5_9BACT|nr:OmpA family protein [Flectobacillus longus]MDI9866933.1 OmpA family protein [Flectobacillus longus]
MKFAFPKSRKKILLGLMLGTTVSLDGCRVINKNRIYTDERWQTVQQSPATTNRSTNDKIAPLLTADERVAQYFDQQLVDLRKQVKVSPVTRVNTKLIHIRFDTDSYFIGNSDIPSEFGKMNMASLSRVLLSYPHTAIIMESYTDANGTDAFNDRLSLKRVAQVANWLVLSGVSPNRLKALWYGKRNPVASNDIVDGQRMNRRVEVFIMPNKTLFDKISTEMRVSGTN